MAEELINKSKSDIKLSEIRDTFRLPNKPDNKTSTVVLELSNTLNKSTLLENIRKLNKTEHLNSYHLGLKEAKNLYTYQSYLHRDPKDYIFWRVIWQRQKNMLTAGPKMVKSIYGSATKLLTS